MSSSAVQGLRQGHLVGLRPARRPGAAHGRARGPVRGPRGRAAAGSPGVGSPARRALGRLRQMRLRGGRRGCAFGAAPAAGLVSVTRGCGPVRSRSAHGGGASQAQHRGWRVRRACAAAKPLDCSRTVPCPSRPDQARRPRGGVGMGHHPADETSGGGHIQNPTPGVLRPVRRGWGPVAAEGERQGVAWRPKTRPAAAAEKSGRHASPSERGGRRDTHPHPATTAPQSPPQAPPPKAEQQAAGEP